MSVHREAAVGFERSADAYERGRPSYPEAAVAWLADRLGVTPGRIVVDLAAGTGKLTRLLVPYGARLIAIEPVDGMRAKLQDAVPEAEALAGVADRMPLDDGVADAVTIAQAFHWFATDAAVAEIGRVLVPGGGLGLIWNLRDKEQGIPRAVSDIIEPFRGDTPTAYDPDWRRPLEQSPLFGELEERSFPSEQVVDADGLAARFGSVSFVASLPDEQRERVLAQLRDLVGDGSVRLPYRTQVFVTRRAA